MEERQVVSGELYRHFKGMLYQVIGVAKHSETMESMVVYQALYGDYSMYVRPLSMFLSEVDKEKYPTVEAKYRFTKVERSTLDHKKPEFVIDQQKSESHQEEPKHEQPHMEAKSEKPVQSTFELHPEASLVNEDLLAFLDAKDYAERLEVLYSIRKRIDDRLMSDIEMSLDMPVGQGSIEERINLVRDNLQTMAKFECRRLR